MTCSRFPQTEVYAAASTSEVSSACQSAMLEELIKW